MMAFAFGTQRRWFPFGYDAQTERLFLPWLPAGNPLAAGAFV